MTEELLATITDAAPLDAITDTVTHDIDYFGKVIEGLLSALSAFALNFVGALIIFVVGKCIIKFLLKFFTRVFERSKLEVGVIRFFQSVLKTVFYIILVIIIAGKVGIQTTSLITLLGSAGVAIGLAMQGSLSNFAGGVMILLFKPFVIGDYIVCGSGAEGTVERIDVFYTHLLTIDNKRVLIPNGEITSNRLTNVTAMPVRRLDVKVGISYDSDIDLAKKIVLRLADECGKALPDQPMQALVTGLLDSAVQIELRIWVNKEDYWDTYFYLNEAIKKAFDANGVTIPFNQMDVHVINK